MKAPCVHRSAEVAEGHRSAEVAKAQRNLKKWRTDLAELNEFLVSIYIYIYDALVRT